MYPKGQYFVVELGDHVNVKVEYRDGKILEYNNCQVCDFCKDCSNNIKSVTVTLPHGADLSIDFNDKNINYFIINPND